MAVNRKGGELLPDVPWPVSTGVNTLEGSDDFGLADLGRLQQLAVHEPIVMRDLRRRARAAEARRNEMNKLVDQHPEIRNLPQFQQEVKINEKIANDLKHRIGMGKIASRERINEQAVNIIGREYSERAINSYVNANTNSLGAQVAGSALATQGYGSLAEQRVSILNQMQGLRQESMTAASSYIGKNRRANPESAATIQANAGQMKDLAKELIPITLAMQQLKSQGLDPQGRQRALISTGDKASGLLAYNKLEDEMRSGKGMGAFSAGELRKKEAEAAEKLIKALEELRNSAGKTSKELEGLNQNAEDAAKEFENLSEARGIGGSGGGGYKAIAAWSSAVAQVSNLIGNTIQTIAVDQPMAQMANIGGYANLENQKYDMWRAGNAGNMTERLNMAGWANASEFGKQMATWAGARVVAHGIGGAAAGIMGVAQFADAAASVTQGTVLSKAGIKDATSVQQLAQGAQAMGEGGAQAGIAVMDIKRKLSTSQAEIAANLQAMNTTRSLTHIPGYQLQQYRDHLMYLNRGAQGLGNKADDFIDQAGGTNYINRMTEVGLGGAELGQLSAFGSANMGSTFSADQVIRAKHYENQAWGSAAENMQRMAGFSAAGSQNPMQSMEKVLERAVGSGINSSKALNIIAENTGQLVELDNVRGSAFDTTDAITRAIIGTVDRNNTNKEFAIKKAADAVKSQEDVLTNTSASFAGMSAVSRLQQSTGLDYLSSERLQGTSTSMWQTWREKIKQGKKEEVAMAMQNRGIDVNTSELFKNDPNAFFDAVNQDKVTTLLEQAGQGMSNASVRNFDQLKQWVGKDKKNIRILRGEATAEEHAGAPEWVQKELVALSQAAGRLNPNGDPLDSRRRLTELLGLVSPGKANLPNEGTKTLGAFTLNQEERSLEERQRNEAKKQGMAAIGAGGSGGTTGQLAVTATGRAHQALPGAASAEARFAEAGANMAKNFGESTIKFDNASSTLLTAANKLLEVAGARKLEKKDEEQETQIKKVQDELDKLGKTGKWRVGGPK